MLQDQVFTVFLALSHIGKISLLEQQNRPTLPHPLVLRWLGQNVPMQGGRDKLGWIRQLVRYTETHPIYIADNASSAVEVLKDGSIQKTVFPSLKPNRREDALLLQQWLADMMAQLTANAPQVSSDQVISAHAFVTHCRSLSHALLPTPVQKLTRPTL